MSTRPMTRKSARITRLAAGYGGDDPDRLTAFELGFEPASLACVDSLDVDVHERPQLSALVEDQVAHRKSAQRVADRRTVHLELLLTARLLGEKRGQANGYCHSAT